MSLPKQSISPSEWDRRQVKLTEKFGSDLNLAEFAAAFAIELEEVNLDGLREFHVFVIEDPVIGYWAIDQCQFYPEKGSIIWADGALSERELVRVVQRDLDWPGIRFVSQETGEIW